MFTIETAPRTDPTDRRTWAYALDAETVRAAVRSLQANPNIIVFINGARVSV